MPTCLLVRHGRTAANADGTLAGWTPGIPLDDTGRDQVKALAERLATVPLAVVVTSPLQRCVETAQLLIGARAELDALPDPVTDDGLGECRYGAWTGLLLKDLAKEPLWRVVQDQPSAARFPDGEEYAAESLAEMQLRAVRAVRQWDRQVEERHGPRALWLAVSHGDVIKAVLADAAGSHLDHFQRIVVNPASLSVVSYTDRRPFVIRTNDVGADVASLVPELPPAGEEAPEGDAAVGGGSGPGPSTPD